MVTWGAGSSPKLGVTGRRQASGAFGVEGSFKTFRAAVRILHSFFFNLV